jgi:fatty acid CoA ligase FadD9
MTEGWIMGINSQAEVGHMGAGGAQTQTRDERIAQRIANLHANDQQFRDARVLATAYAAIQEPCLRLPQIVSRAMEAYTSRPALGRRARELVTNPATGRNAFRLLPEFETISYGKLWTRARALASAWQHDAAAPVLPRDFICIMGFASIDYAVIDLACLHYGVVFVPLQTNGATSQLVQIIEEIQPRCLATNMDCLDAAVDSVLAGANPASLLVFDYEPEDDAQKDRFESAQRRLADAANPIPVHSLASMIELGKPLPQAPLFVAAADEDPLTMIFYTSGSTGTPKGAMYTERMVKSPWLTKAAVPLICLNYMPLNHSFGRSWMASILTNGGTCFFTAKSDLSTLFEDIGIVRPTTVNLVPRICEMVFHQYQKELDRRAPDSADHAVAGPAVMAELRQNFFGGRVLSCTTGAAPLSPEMHAFIESCFDVKLNSGYGATEVGGAISFNSKIVRPPIIDYKLVDVPELGYFGTDKPHPRGELLVKSLTIMPGYFKRPEITAAVFDEDGYYKTGDIMAEIGPDEIVYVDRRNNVLKLAQGEFVAVANLEATFSSGHPFIRQIYVYGSSERSCLLAVIVPQLEAIIQLGHGTSDEEIKVLVRDAINEIAKTASLKAYEVPRDFLIETEAFSVENGLLTGVGKHLRPGLKARYGARLEQLYADIAQDQANELRALRQGSRSGPVLETVGRAVQATLGISSIDLTAGTSFADLGGDSLSALSFSMLLEEIFGIEVPVGVVISPTASLQQLAKYITSARDSSSNRPTFSTVHGRNSTEIHARELTLDKFIDAQTLADAKALSQPGGEVKTVLLTGANGFLGRFLCIEWLERLAKVDGKLICITRGHTAAAARQRIAEVLDSGDAELSRHFEILASRHLEVVAGDIGEPNLGLDETTWKRLATSVDLIVHPAALVNHILPYSQLFGPNVVGTAELIRLAITTRLKPFNNVSTVAAAMLGHEAFVSEDADIRIACPMRVINKNYANGYAISKWAGEVLLREAHELCGLPVAVFRSDMILAHSRYAGQLNVPDMFTRLLYSLVTTGIAPSSFYVTQAGVRARAHYDGLPVDFTAEAIAALGGSSSSAAGYQTYHVLNPHDDGISLDDFVDWMVDAGHPIQRVTDYKDWFARFEAAMRALPEQQRQHSVLPLLDAFRHPSEPVYGSLVPAEKFRAAVQAAELGPDHDIPHLSAQLIRKYIADLQLLKLV